MAIAQQQRIDQLSKGELPEPRELRRNLKNILLDYKIGNKEFKLVQECTNNAYERNEFPLAPRDLQRISQQRSRRCFLHQIEVIGLARVSLFLKLIFIQSNSDHKFYSLSHNSNSAVDGASSHARRHSVGTFAGKDKICTTSFIDEAPLEIAPRAPSQFRRTNRGESRNFHSQIRSCR